MAARSGCWAAVSSFMAILRPNRPNGTLHPESLLAIDSDSRSFSDDLPMTHMPTALSTPDSVSARKLAKRLRRRVGQAIADYGMIEQGDRVMVCLSGGKDSYTLLDMLLSLQRSAPVDFALTAVNLDQKQPGFPAEVLPDYLTRLGIDYRILEQDTYSVVQRVVPAGKTYCGLCSRLRRGALYEFAAREGYTKIALGHHRDDILETLFLNLFHGGRLAAMPPRLRSDDGRHTVIRPLAYCTERDIARYSALQGHPIIPCTLCGSQETAQRQAIKRMLATWEREMPGRAEVMMAALQNVRPSHLLDRSLHDFGNGTSESDDDGGWLVPRRAPVAEEEAAGPAASFGGRD